MSRPVKAKAEKKAVNNRNKKLFSKPEKIAVGTTLIDNTKTQWRIGASIGTGGFGDIYSACRVGEDKHDFVVKCEPHSNGPLFVEMHFYMRNAKYEDIEKFKSAHGLKSLGMPYMLGSGSVELNGQKHRFIVMPRYECDILKFYKTNSNQLPEGAIYRIALQMLDVYEFIHQCGYVHADLKAANILIGRGKNGAQQTYLVDYGLASHYTTKEFKPDPKKMHNGTIEYTSRDAHQGVATRRGDFEILAYNLIDWWGNELPWVRDKLCAIPGNVEKSKVKFWDNINTEIRNFLRKPLSVPITAFIKYVANMRYNDSPDYDYCRELFVDGLKKLKLPKTGEIEFSLKKSAKEKHNESLKLTDKRSKKQTEPVVPSIALTPKQFIRTTRRSANSSNKANANSRKNHSDNEIELSDNGSEDEDWNEHVEIPKKKRSAQKSKRPIQPTKIHKSNNLVSTPETPPAVKRMKMNQQGTPIGLTNSGTKKTPSTPKSTVSLNFSPSVSLSSRPGKTIINDNLTPQESNKKTYEFNFELDVSLDANVIVNVKRKKKAAAEKSESIDQTASHVEVKASPVPRAHIRHRHRSNGELSDTNNHIASPNVTIRKSRRI